MPADILVQMLTVLAIIFEIGFLFWYLFMMAVIGQTIRAAKEIDHISIGMFGVELMGLSRCCWLIWHLATVPTPPDQLVARIALDAIRAVITTYFIWHLRLKELVKEWLNNG